MFSWSGLCHPHFVFVIFFLFGVLDRTSRPATFQVEEKKKNVFPFLLPTVNLRASFFLF